MFYNANVLIDEYARPIFIIEEEIHSDNLVIQINDDNKMVFSSQGKMVGQLDNVDENIMLLSLAQDEIGIIAYDIKNEIPDTYTHIAKLVCHNTETVGE